MDGVGEALRLFQVRGGGLAPQEIGVWREGQTSGDGGLQPIRGEEVPFGRALAGEERTVPLVNVARDEGRGPGVGPGNQ